MVKIIKTGNDAYFVDADTGEVVKKYSTDRNLNFVMKLEDGSVLQVSNDSIKHPYGNQTFFEYDNDKYIIEDGYQSKMIRSGYIILNQYDIEHIEDKKEGIELRDQLLKKVSDAVYDAYYTQRDDGAIFTKENTNYNEFVLTFRKGAFEYRIVIDTVNSIVTKNQQRKANSLPFYPFNKDMDKYGTLYLSIFVEKFEDVECNDDKEKYNVAEEVITDIIKYLNKSGDNTSYHYERIIVKRSINFCEGI